MIIKFSAINKFLEDRPRCAGKAHLINVYVSRLDFDVLYK